MKRRTVGLVLALALGSCLTAAAVETVGPYELMPRDEEIALARTAGLAPWSGSASVYVLGFSGDEGAELLGVSEPQFRHRLAAARDLMIESFEGMCQLINTTGAFWQCRGLRELAPDAIVRDADLEHGASAALHEDLFHAVNLQEDALER
jgi:hypothetical protein